VTQPRLSSGELSSLDDDAASAQPPPGHEVVLHVYDLAGECNRQAFDATWAAR
jgi:hypothetical protein